MAKMLDEGIQKQVREVFAELDHPVEILYFKSELNCDYCGETQQILEEVATLSDRLQISVHDLDVEADLAARFHLDKAPGFSIVGRDGDQLIDYGIRYAGIPAGHEFTSLIHDLVMISKRDSGLSPQTRAYLGTLTEPVMLQVFTTPT